jgi:hypothetical protein
LTEEDEELERLILASRVAATTSILLNFMGLNYVKFYEEILEIEALYGSLPIFEIPSYFPEDRRIEIRKYKLRELVGIRNTMSGIRNLLALSEPPSDGIGWILRRIRPSFQAQVEMYLAYFELIYENFITPLVERAAKKPKRGYDNWIKCVRNLLEELETNKTPNSHHTFWIQGLDGTLRNALVHKNYYIKEGVLYYYQTHPRKEKVRFETKQLAEFEKQVGFIFFQRWMFNIITGLRLGQTSLAEVKKLSETKIITFTDSTKEDHDSD